MSAKKAVVAMSGGVDSSVAAALLKQQGYDLIGITMQVWPSKKDFGGCCSLSAIDDARRVAQKLDIPHYVLNFRDEFQKMVIDNFIEEYKNGRTPNPCIRCNQFMKFDLLMKKAKELDCQYVATGHYARIAREIPNPKSQIPTKSQFPKYKLLKGIDAQKDQSYVLYMATQETLARSLFPLGELTKKEVRKMARELELPVADKEESQEICFIEDDNYGRFLKDNVPGSANPGEILDAGGNAAGRHEGIAFYTIGQRKGIGAHNGRPKYVIGIDRKKNTVIIGGNNDLFRDALTADNVSFVSGVKPSGPLPVKAKIRYNSPEEEALLSTNGGGSAKVRFSNPVRAVAPGQSVVFYSGDEVIGGGIIREDEEKSHTR